MQYDVVLTKHQNNGYTARPVLWPEVVATGDSEEEALAGVQSLLADLPVQKAREEAESKIVQLEVLESERIVEPFNKEKISSQKLDFAEKRRRMSQEKRVYQQLLPELRKKYLGQYVAVFQGELIDHDEDELILLRRIDKRFPNDVVLLTRVLAGPEPIFHMRSPRLVSNI